MLNTTPYLYAAMMATALIGISSAEDAATVKGAPARKTDDYPLTLPQIRVRDPFIVADTASKTYFLYAQGGNRPNNDNADLGVEAYRSKDLALWSKPTRVFDRPKSGFWGTPPIWAPEVHRLGNAYYMFATLRGRAGAMGSQIMHADQPGGPFVVLGDEANTPPEQRCLDATPWIEADGNHWMVYCHEWAQIGDGAVRAVRMSEDWSKRIDEPILLFHASQADWVGAYPKKGQYVTDGPFLHRTKGGALLMIWSSFTKKGGYAIGLVKSESGTVKGPWKHQPEVLYGKQGQDGGHGMIFRDFSGDLRLIFHQPNGGTLERPKILKLKEVDDTLVVDKP